MRLYDMCVYMRLYDMCVYMHLYDNMFICVYMLMCLYASI